MSDLTEFQQRIEEQLNAALDEKRRCQSEREQRQIDLDLRIEQFRVLATRMIDEIVRPRVAAMAAKFENAALVPPSQTPSHVVSCRLAHCDRFPATTKLTFALFHDSSVESLGITFDLEILPVFIKYEGHDQKFIPLSTLDEHEVAAWIEAKLINFVETYLRLERTPAYQHDNLVSDPVCGTTITRNCAVSQEERGGQTFYFCSEHCHRKFLASNASSDGAQR